MSAFRFVKCGITFGLFNTMTNWLLLSLRKQHFPFVFPIAINFESRNDRLHVANRVFFVSIAFPLKIAFRHIRPDIMNLALFDFVCVFSEIVSVFEVVQTHLYQTCDLGILFIHVFKKNYICI